MSHKRFLVELTSEERACLKQLVACGSAKTLPRHRAQIWLLCDQGPEGPAWTDARPASKRSGTVVKTDVVETGPGQQPCTDVER